MKLLRHLYRQSWAVLLAATIGAVISGVAGAALIGLIGQGITGGGEPLMLGLSLLGLGVLQLLTKTGSEIALLRGTQNAVAHLRERLSRAILTSPYPVVQKVGQSELLVMLTKDIETFVSAVQLVPALFADFIVIICCVVYMAFLSPVMTGVFLVCLVLCSTAYRIAQRAPSRMLDAMRSQMGDLFYFFHHLTEGNKELRLNRTRRSTFFDEVLDPTADKSRITYERAMSSFAWLNNTAMMMFYVVIGALLFVLPRYAPQSLVTLTKLTLTLLYLVRPILSLTSLMPAVAQSTASLRRLEQLEGDLGEARPPSASSGVFTSARPLCLELRAVCHRYNTDREDQHFMLGPIDLAIREGDMVFIVGGNGSGKTTLAMLLLGLYTPEIGTVLLNDVPVTPDNEAEYCGHFSAVFSDFHLFDHVLIPLDATMTARAHHYIKRLGLDHKVGIENGMFTTIALSTGQRKRLALVVAYLEDCPIYLFDEWAADQDPVFKQVFYLELLPELKARGKTVIAITHDDRYFHVADRVIKLQDGRLQDMALLSNARGPIELV